MAESSNQPKNCILSRSSFQRIIKTLESYMDKKGIKYMNQRADCRYIHDETSENHKPYENTFSELNAWSLALEKRLVCVSYSRTSTMFTPLPSRLMQAYYNFCIESPFAKLSSAVHEMAQCNPRTFISQTIKLQNFPVE